MLIGLKDIAGPHVSAGAFTSIPVQPAPVAVVFHRYDAALTFVVQNSE